MAENGPKNNPILMVVGAVVGVVIGRYSAMNLIIPLVSAAIVAAILNKTLDARKKPMLAAIAIQAGHAIWMIFGVVTLAALGEGSLASLAPLVIVDVVILVAGVIWLGMRPGIAAVVALSAYQVIALGVNLISFAGAEVGSIMHRALVVHLILRAIAVAAMFKGLMAMQKKQAEASGQEAAPNAMSGPMQGM